jgi:hypothetical protein
VGLFEDIGQSASSFVASVTNDAEAFVSGAQNNVAQLLNSGVNSQGRVTGPLAEQFGSDPMEFMLNATRHFSSFLRGTCDRVAERSGQAAFAVPAPRGGGTMQVPTRVRRDDPTAKLALVVALNATERPAVLLEEVGRQQQGLPVKRGLDGGSGGYVWFPPTMPARGLFGIDDAVLIGSVIAIIVAIAPALIAALISVVGSVSKQAGDALGGLFGPKAPPPPPPGLFGIDGLDPVMAAIIGGAVLVGGFLLVRSRMS